MNRLSLSFLALICVLTTTATAQRPGGNRSAGGSAGRSEPMGPPPESVAGPGYSTSKRAEDEARVEFKSETIVVQVPVVVTDKSGNHVHGLTKDKFQISENNKDQTISSFEEIINTSAPISVVTRPGFYSNLLVDRDKPRAVTIIALDMVNTPILDQSYARRELIKYLSNNIDTGQTLALVLITEKGLKVAYGLTSSAKTPQEVLKNVSSESYAMQNVSKDAEVAAATGDTSTLMTAFTLATTETRLNEFITQSDVNCAQFKQEQAIETTMQAFLGIAWSVSGIPGRKTLLWATGGFPFVMDSPSSVPGGRLSLLYERAMKALNDGNVSIYPVDVLGLINIAPGADVGTVPKGPASMRQLSNRSWLVNTKQDTLKDFAEMTGGRAFYNTNDLAGAFQRVTDDASSYYMLTYHLDTKNNKPGWRSLKVKVDQKDVEIRARKGFFVTNATLNPDASRLNDMEYALSAPFEATAIPIVMQWGASKDVPGNEKKQIPFTIRIAGNEITVDGTHSAMNVGIAAVATQPSPHRKDEFLVVDRLAEDVKGELKPENLATLRSRGMSYNNTLELAPGTYSVRFVVRDNLSGRLGSVSAPLTVN